MNQTDSISAGHLSELLATRSNSKVIDVRTPVEYREVHIGAARNLPLDRIDSLAAELSQSSATEPTYIVCKSGTRAQQACSRLAAAGCQNLVLVEGGTDAWVQAGLPVVRGKKAISLERQVRIAAGALVLTGVALGLAWHPGGFGLAAFVGAGLVFAGVTDTCGMGLLLAKMPWNQAPGSS